MDSMLRLMCSPAWMCTVLLLSLECFLVVSADDEGCYTSGSVAGIVIATVVVTLVMGALAAAFIWYLWRQRKGDIRAEKSQQEKGIACPPMSPDKQLLARENNDYAFDNPYFKDDEVDHIKQDAAEKGESGFHMDNGDVTPSQNSKASNGTTGGHQKKTRPFSSLPFHAVFHPSGKKQRATMDDTYIAKHPERLTVPLRGHDFTGLGFNICGNMRDGIFVKDVLHRGPASESGKIKAGDRIVGVTVSFGGMVYEDALTILSYASPYDVKLEIEKSSSVNNVGSASNLPSSSPKRIGASTSFRNCGQRGLFHPLYRSQSIHDLTQIGKDSILSSNSPAINTKNQKDSSTSATPKRSQSVEASNAVVQKTRANYALKSNDEADSIWTTSKSSNKGSRKSSTSSCDSTGKTTASVPVSEKLQTAAPAKEEAPCVKKEVKSSRFRVEQISVKSEAPVPQTKQAAPPAKPTRETSEDKQTTDTVELNHVNEKSAKEESEELTITVEPDPPQNVAEAEADATEKPTAPPRKMGTPAKRKAPAPPPAAPTKTETSAVVHRVDEQPAQVPENETVKVAAAEPAEASEPPPPPTSEVPESTRPEKIVEPDLASSNASSLASGGHGSQPDPKDEPSSPSKRKASSLGDLTKLDQGANKKASISSAILERAVSMDLQQSIPGENLIKQKKILRAPAFEVDYDENRESDLNDTDGGGGLKRWDDGLDKVFVGLTNGHIEHIHEPEINGISEKTEEKESILLNGETSDEAPSKTLLTVDVDLDCSGSEAILQESQDPEKQLTSTPSRKVIEVKNFMKDDDISLDEVPYLASANTEKALANTEIEDDSSTIKHSIRTTSSTASALFSPVTISIPIIKPDLTHFEKLPSPPPANTHPSLDPSWRVSKIASTAEETARYPLERISVQSLYRPIFSNKESSDADELPSPIAISEKLVNGNDSDSSEHYSTAQENNTTSSLETSTLSVTLSPMSANNVTVKTPNNVAGFAKTLIIPGPNEVESLLSLAAEPNTPPPQLDPPPKAIENK